MSRFKKCAKVAHAKLHTFFPQVSLGQTQQILAAALGHKSYASFLESDLSAFDEHAAYAVLVPSSAMLRALDFGLEMNRDHWDLLISEISEKQVTGDLELCVDLLNVYWRARYEFFDGQYSEIDALVHRYGNEEVFRQLRSEASHCNPEYADDGEQLADRYFITLQGEICVTIEPRLPSGLGIPVLAEFGFKRVGRRLLAQSELTSLQEDGPLRECNPQDELDYSGGMTFD
ncbi:hypothetical protein MCEMSHM24_02435 [Comamonadaceae bacterium]